MLKIGQKYKLDHILLKQHIKQHCWNDTVLENVKNFKYVTVECLDCTVFSMDMYKIEESNRHYYPEDCFKPLRTQKLKRILS